MKHIPRQPPEGYRFVDAVTSVGKGDWDTSVEGDDGHPKLPWDNLRLSAGDAVILATKVYEKHFGPGWHVEQHRPDGVADRLALIAGQALVGVKPVRIYSALSFGTAAAVDHVACGTDFSGLK